MKIDKNKIDDAVLSLLHLTSFKEKDSVRAWKGHDWDSLDRLYEKGMIYDPKNKAKSVVMTTEGTKTAEQLFSSMFAES